MRKSFLALLLLPLLFSLHAWGMHSLFTSISTADFFPRWYGARALLIHGQNPYSDQVTTEIEAILDPKNEATNSFNFAFPLHAILLFFPLAYLPLAQYSWVQALWLTSIQWVTALAAWLLCRQKEWRPPPIELGMLILTAVFFYPIFRTLMLGQFTMHVTFFLIASLTLWQKKEAKPFWAGVLLSLTTVKPQMIVFLLPWLALYAFSRKEWQFLKGLLGSGALLLLGSLLLVPTWLFDFYHGLFDYAEVASGKPPLILLAQLLHLPNWSSHIFLILLLIPLLYRWWQSWGKTGPLFERALHWTIIVTLLAPFQTGTTNHLLLLIPLFHWWYSGLQKHRWLTLAIQLTVLIALWALFLTTIQGNYEHPAMFLPLPLFSLALLIWEEWRTPIIDE